MNTENIAWVQDAAALRKTFVFSSFELAMEWMQEVAVSVSRLDHHPEWTNVYNKVMVVLSTHSAGNQVTAKDHELAALMDASFDKFQTRS